VNYYELLNIERGANTAEIKRAYFSAVKLHSPDSDPDGFKAIRIAYETLYDPKKRAEYDAYFVTSGDTQNDLLAARSMIREHKYKQASEFLSELCGKYPDSADVKRLLAEVLWKLKKSGTADKLCGEVLEKNPSNCDTLLLRAKIAHSMRHVDKADTYFDDAVNAAPLNPKTWVEYLRYSMRDAPWQVAKVFYRAMEQDINMFRDDYIFYLVGARETTLFSEENKLQYYNKFAEFFVNDKNMDEDTYSQVMDLMPGFMEKDELFPFIEKIVPTLEKSRYNSDEDKEKFKYIHMTISIHKLDSDKRIHDVLADLTRFFLLKDNDINERLSMECYIVFNLPALRPSIMILKNEYPEYFKLNQIFYLNALNEKKTNFLLDKYAGISKKLIHGTKNKPVSEVFFDDYDNTEEITPFRRESPKVGRNDPCPCGSGKKYKKCCG
jgi:curved DNA-binding protein CbpA